jgi:PadR family transcriptional regulator, regulatory protein PadR
MADQLGSCRFSLLQVSVFYNIMHYMVSAQSIHPPKTGPQSKAIERSRERLRTQMYKGVAELALLCLVQESPEYGLRILELLRDEAGLEIAEGTLYPLLYRLEKQGSIKSEWRILDDASHPRKYYAITAQGKAELKAYVDDWQTMTATFNRFLNRGKK